MNMETPLLGIMIASLFTVFAVDTSQKRRNDQLEGKQ
jgi:hypothetical protein